MPHQDNTLRSQSISELHLFPVQGGQQFLATTGHQETDGKGVWQDEPKSNGMFGAKCFYANCLKKNECATFLNPK